VDWVKLSARYYLDRAIAGLDDAGEVMFTRAVAYAGDQETGGFIPAGMLHVFSRSRRYEATAGALVAAGLWLPARGGFEITRWEEWQSELEAIARRRSADRDRKRRIRAAAKTAQTSPNGAVDNPVPPHGTPVSFERSENNTDQRVRGQSADSPQESFSSLSSGTGGIESKKDPPNPPQAGGHAGQHQNCRACGTSRRPKPPKPPTPPPVAEAIAAALTPGHRATTRKDPP
jgi:hypothetical protein